MLKEKTLDYTESYYTLLYAFLSQRFLPNVSDISWMFIQRNVCNPKALRLCQIKGKKRYYPSFEWKTWPLPSYSQFTVWRTAGSEIFWTFLKSFCPCCYLTWLSKPFSHEINELKNTAETHACVKKCMHKHHAIIYELLTAAVTWYMLLQNILAPFHHSSGL